MDKSLLCRGSKYKWCIYTSSGLYTIHTIIKQPVAAHNSCSSPLSKKLGSINSRIIHIFIGRDRDEEEMKRDYLNSRKLYIYGFCSLKHQMRGVDKICVEKSKLHVKTFISSKNYFSL